jgi:response regulator NasT
MRRNIFLIKSNLKRSELLKLSLHQFGYEVTAEAMADNDFLPALEACEPHILIIDCDAPSDLLLARLRDLSLYKPMPVVLFTEQDNRSIIQQAVRAGVSAYIVNGLDQQRLGSILEVAVARFQETGRLHQELAETRANLTDRKNVERAKGILMKQRGLDESAAYHALRKMAMDKNLRVGQVAENVIAVAELLT